MFVVKFINLFDFYLFVKHVRAFPINLWASRSLDAVVVVFGGGCDVVAFS